MTETTPYTDALAAADAALAKARVRVRTASTLEGLMLADVAMCDALDALAELQKASGLDIQSRINALNAKLGLVASK